MGLQFFENLLMTYNYVIAIHDISEISFLDNEI